MKGRYLGDFKGFSNNLGFLRMAAAMIVICSHSFTVSGTGWDPLDNLTAGTMSLGGLAVVIFFFSSGYFVTGSIIKNNSGKKYFAGRFSRLYPAFFAVVILSAFVLGPVVSTLDSGAYFTSPQTYTYLMYLFMIPRYILPGVFETNPIQNTVNGPLWTMTLETIAYILLFVLWKIKLLNKKSLKILLPVFLVFMILSFGIRIPVLNQFHGYLRPLCVFFVGSFFNILKDRISFKWIYVLIGAVGLAACFVFGLYDLGMVVFFPYLLTCVIFASVQLPGCLGELGKYSYFMYLVAFPIQQTLQNYNPEMSQLLNFVLSTLISAVVAVIGYHCIEKPGGRFVDKLFNANKND